MSEIIVTRTEKHVIKKTNKYFNMLLDFCRLSKNLYNHANYVVKHEFINSGKWIRYQELENNLKNDIDFPDYRNMPFVGYIEV